MKNMAKAKNAERPMKCFTCGEQVTLKLDDTADEQRDAFAKQHTHNPDWVRWLRRDE